MKKNDIISLVIGIIVSKVVDKILGRKDGTAGH